MVTWIPYIPPVRLGTDFSLDIRIYGRDLTDKSQNPPVSDLVNLNIISDTYSDVNSFTPSKSVPKLVDMNSVYQSIMNILNTNKRERVFLPEFGADLDKLLFELMNFETSIKILTFITNAINRWEPRVRVRTDISRVIPDPENHKYDVTVYFEVKGLEGKVFEVSSILEAS